jgi:glyoxalase/bleomycin resistance protein/dioxygenase superfamily protein
MALALLICSPIAPGEQKALRPIVRQVDHIVVQTNDPKTLFNFFTDTLQFPIAWQVMEYDDFISGGIGAGSVSIEVFRYTGRKSAESRAPRGARFMGIAFQPVPLSESLPELESRGLKYSPPEPFVSTLPDGSQGPLWTTVVLPQFSGSRLSTFLYEYSPAFLNIYVRRKQVMGQLVLNGGGPLGFQSVKEIVIEAEDLEKDTGEWQKLLVKRVDAPGIVWQVGDGPAIRLVPGEQERIRSIVFKVQSLEKAAAFLKKNSLLGAGTGSEISIDRRKIQGLNIRLVERKN